MTTALIILASFLGGAVATLCLAALASGSVGDPDDDSEVNGPEFL